MPGPPPPLPPLYRAAGGGRGSEDGCWRSRPAPAHPRRLCPARSPGGGGGPSPPLLLAVLLPSLRRSPAPFLPSLPLLSPLAFSFPLSFPSPSVLSLHPALSREGSPWVSSVLDTAGSPSGRCVRGYQRPLPVEGMAKTPTTLPPNPIPAAPPRAVESRGFPSGPAPVAGTESARRGSPCGQVLPPRVGAQRTQRCQMLSRGALEALIAICRRAAAAPGR